MLKGGLVLELRLERARTTKDVDLRIMGAPEDVLPKLQEAGRRDLGDFMLFEVGPDGIAGSRVGETDDPAALDAAASCPMGAIAVFVLLYHWLLRRDWRAGAVLAGLAGGYLPWFNYQHRTIYSFYSIAFEPWVVLGVVFVLGLVLGRRGAPWRRRQSRRRSMRLWRREAP